MQWARIHIMIGLNDRQLFWKANTCILILFIIKWHNVWLPFRPSVSSCHAVYLVLFVIIYQMWISNSIYGLISVEIKPNMVLEAVAVFDPCIIQTVKNVPYHYKYPSYANTPIPFSPFLLLFQSFYHSLSLLQGPVFLSSSCDPSWILFYCKGPSWVFIFKKSTRPPPPPYKSNNRSLMKKLYLPL